MFDVTKAVERATSDEAFAARLKDLVVQAAQSEGEFPRTAEWAEILKALAGSPSDMAELQKGLAGTPEEREAAMTTMTTTTTMTTVDCAMTNTTTTLSYICGPTES